MRVRAFWLGFAAAPMVLCSAFVPSAGVAVSSFAGLRSSTFTSASTAARAGLATAMQAGGLSVSMSAAEKEEGAGHEDQDQAWSSSSSWSRGQFLGRVSAGAAAVAATAGGWAAPASADSTGKYSSKATAKKRYLPRIAKMVSAFQVLKKDITSGSASPKSEFFVDLLPDSVSAMALYGSSMKKGELPDSKSRALQQLAQDFGSQCESIAKSLGKKGGEADAGKAYDKASVILEQYLKGVELDPLGSASYN